MNFSIRGRLFINVLVLMLPLIFFAWLLVKEINKQIDFAEQEKKGLIVQKPLLHLLNNVHLRKIALHDSESTQSLDKTIEENKAAFNEAYDAHAKDIGFVDAKWTGLKTDLESDLAKLNANNDTSNSAAHDKAIASIRAVISRASDGSNLTLDPDLDSYYTMDAVAFAVPSGLDNLGKAEEALTTIIENRKDKEPLSQSDYAEIENWKYIISTTDESRVLGSLNTALTEDPNFYGASPTFGRIKPFMDDYEKSTNALLVLLDEMKKPDGTITEKNLKETFTHARTPLMEIGKIGMDELAVLLNRRNDDAKAHMQELLLQGGAAVLIGLVLFFLISNSIVGPINQLREIMKRLAGGAIDIEIPHTKKRDEIGQMAQSVVVFRQNAQQLRVFAQDFESSVKQVVESVASAATEMSATSENLSQQTGSIQMRLTELAHNVNNVSSNMQTVSAASIELDAAINEIGSQVQRSSDANNTAVAKASEVRKVAEGLSDAAQKVSGIVGIINSIASKITLLSLNATIEAARAGEAGKGFAVVATEVKALAAQTTGATSEINELVVTMQDRSKETLGAITTIAETIEQISQISSTIAAAVEEQGMATREITGQMQQATASMSGVSENTTVISEAASASNQASTQSLQATNELSQQSEKLRLEVDKFINRLRST